MKHAIQLESMDQKKKMNKWLKWTLIILAILAVIIIGLLIYVNAYIDRSLAQTGRDSFTEWSGRGSDGCI